MLPGMVDEHCILLLQGMRLAWRSEFDKGREERRVPLEFEQCSGAEVRRQRDRQGAAVGRTIASLGFRQATVFLGSALFGWRAVVSGARQLRRHAEHVFLVMCQGDMELGNLALRASLQAWADARRLARQQEQREVHRQHGL
jgi:hypothetical protein